jgi:hypothetical protein
MLQIDLISFCVDTTTLAHNRLLRQLQLLERLEQLARNMQQEHTKVAMK